MAYNTVKVLFLLIFPIASNATTCPPAGERYISDNFVRRSEIVSLGSTHDGTLGCKWRRDDGKEIWLDLGPTVKPIAQTKAKDVAAQADKEKAASQAVQFGVYECNGPHGVQTGPMFGLIDGRRYRAFDGGTGTYRYDATLSLLEISSGPLTGMRYRRTGDTLFKPLGEKGQTGPIVCLIHRGKSISGKW